MKFLEYEFVPHCTAIIIIKKNNEHFATGLMIRLFSKQINILFLLLEEGALRTHHRQVHPQLTSLNNFLLPASHVATGSEFHEEV